MNTVRSPRRRRAAATALTVAGLLATLLGHQVGAAATAGSGAARPTSSPFGELVVTNGARCSSGGAEVAFVADRLVVQTTTPGRVSNEIVTWLAAARAAAPAASQKVATPAGSSRGPTDRAADEPGGADQWTARIVDRIDFPTPDDDQGPIAPVYAIEVDGPVGADVLGVARHLTGKGFDASPDYIHLMQGGRDFFQPESIPQPWADAPIARTLTTTSGSAVGHGIRIHVYDTGLAAADPSDLLANVTALRANDIEIPDRLRPGYADDMSVGHALAISSEIGTLVPGAIVENGRVTRAGLSTDFSSAKRIASTLNHSPSSTWPHLIVAAFTSMACDLDPLVPGDELIPVSLGAVSRTVDRLGVRQPGGMTIVAAAGNHGTSRRGYPAAFDGVLAVGALDASLDDDGDPMTSASRTAPVASFSAHGDWVDVYAPGADLVTLHVDGITFETVEDDVIVETLIEGVATVRGTSFAAPYVAAQLAELMSTEHVTAGRAFELLVAGGVSPQPPCDIDSAGVDLGPGVAVALAARDASSIAPATATAVDVC